MEVLEQLLRNTPENVEKVNKSILSVGGQEFKNYYGFSSLSTEFIYPNYFMPTNLDVVLFGNRDI